VIVSTFELIKCVNPYFNYYKTKSDVATFIGLIVKFRSVINII
jgi:hypothetical protein